MDKCVFGVAPNPQPHKPYAKSIFNAPCHTIWHMRAAYSVFLTCELRPNGRKSNGRASAARLLGYLSRYSTQRVLTVTVAHVARGVSLALRRGRAASVRRGVFLISSGHGRNPSSDRAPFPVRTPTLCESESAVSSGGAARARSLSGQRKVKTTRE